MRVTTRGKRDKNITALMKHTSQFGETKINMISRMYRFQVVMGAKGKCKRALGGADIFRDETSGILLLS